MPPLILRNIHSVCDIPLTLNGAETKFFLSDDDHGNIDSKDDPSRDNHNKEHHDKDNKLFFLLFVKLSILDVGFV